MSVIVHYEYYPGQELCKTNFGTEIMEGCPSRYEIIIILKQQGHTIGNGHPKIVKHPNTKEEEHCCRDCCENRIRQKLYESTGHGPSRNNPNICVECKYNWDNKEKL